MVRKERSLFTDPAVDPFPESSYYNEIKLPKEDGIFLIKPAHYENSFSKSTLLNTPDEYYQRKIESLQPGAYGELNSQNITDISIVPLSSMNQSSQVPVTDYIFKKLTLNQETKNKSYKLAVSPVINSVIQRTMLSASPAPFNIVGNVFGATKPEDLPEMALPVLELIEQVQPHIVIGCDRGARLFGLAMHAAWQATRNGAPFPTLDGKIHFARISKSEDFDVLQDKVDEVVDASLRFGEQRGRSVQPNERLRVLFVDDWIVGGGTRRLAEKLVRKYDAESFFAVMSGPGADATGQQQRHTIVSWHDKPEEIGVNYLSTLYEDSDGTVVQRQEAVPVKGAAASSNRKKIQRAAKLLALDRELARVA